MMAAPRLRVPAAVHEQNARLGRVNRFVANRMNAIALSFEDTDGVPSDRAAVSVTGNPVRDSIVALRSQGYTPPDADGDIRILITGGSQGAEIFSDVVPMALGGLPLEIRKRLRVTQQCRENTLSRVRDMYAEHDIAAELAPFIENVADCLGAAHLVICRAGASTVAELTVAGRPAILVPYPHARDDHQTANADQLDKANAGWRIAQPEFTAEALRAQLLTLFDQPEKLSDAASNAAALGRPDAAARLADLVETLFVGAQQGRAA
jgi:UDP-N-acetylglucosamine--N-acetylmuramyl-(pentapeptide) pyrophosphoryl-undecaprenol N-acetylglucosamine transferase